MRIKLNMVALVGLLALNIGQYLLHRDLKLKHEKLAADHTVLSHSMSGMACTTNGGAQPEAFLRDQRTGVWEIHLIEALRLRDLVEPQTAQAVVNAVNGAYGTPNYPGIRLERLHNRTAYVRVLDEDLLTQRMGSTGAWHYLAVVTASFTSVPDIDSVAFVFKEGDHAVPGVYTREDFLDLWVYPVSLN
ncbi:MAG TPA: hypothetical protein GXZ82_13875 [Firmicutes bacterium]|nr:hypothetical protein [Bacillota bacterium]